MDGVARGTPARLITISQVDLVQISITIAKERSRCRFTQDGIVTGETQRVIGTVVWTARRSGTGRGEEALVSPAVDTVAAAAGAMGGVRGSRKRRHCRDSSAVGGDYPGVVTGQAERFF